MDHWIYQEPEALKLWLTMLIEANHETKKHMFNGAVIEIRRGQLVCGRISLSEKTGVSENKIRRYINLLESDGMIHQQKTNKYSIITIVKYEQYQEKHQQKTSKSPTDDQQTTTPKQLNNKTINKQHAGLDFSSWPELPKQQIVDDWFAMRKRIKADVSQTVIDQFAKQMDIAVNSGSTVDYCLSECITSNWRGFKFQWIKNQEQSHAGHKSISGQSNKTSKSDQNDEAIRKFLAETIPDGGDVDGFIEYEASSFSSGQHRAQILD
jgi:predicted transcriptional regulator